MKFRTIGLCTFFFLTPFLLWADTVPNVIVYSSENPIITDTVFTPDHVYVLEGSVTVPSGITLTIEPGVVVKGERSSGANGKLVVDGSLIATSTADNPIIFTSYADDSFAGDTNMDVTSSDPMPGDWDGIDFEASSTGVIDHAKILYAGVAQDGGSVHISNSSIEDSASAAIDAQAGNDLSLINDEFIHNAETGIVSPSIHFVHSGNTSSDLSRRGFWMIGNVKDGAHLNSADLPILVMDGDLHILAEATVTIDPGTVIKFDQGAELTIDGTLVAHGTSDARISFTSIKDDSDARDSTRAYISFR